MEDGALLTQWQAFLLTEKRVAKNTYQAYCSDIAQFCTFLQEYELALNAVKQVHIKAFIRHLHANAVGARSIARKIAAIKSLYTYLARQHDMQNHAQDIIIPKIEKRLPKYLSEKEIAQLLLINKDDTAPLGYRNHVIINLLYATGMRISELATLTIGSLRPDEQLICVIGKGSKERFIPLPKQTMQLLHEYITGIYPALLHNAPITGYEPLFPVMYGKVIKSISRQSLWMIVKRMCKQAGIQKEVSPHQLRHSLATHLLKNGADLRSLQLLLGHEQVGTTEIYTHVETSHIREVYDKKHPRS